MSINLSPTRALVARAGAHGDSQPGKYPRQLGEPMPGLAHSTFPPGAHISPSCHLSNFHGIFSMFVVLSSTRAPAARAGFHKRPVRAYLRQPGEPMPGLSPLKILEIHGNPWAHSRYLHDGT